MRRLLALLILTAAVVVGGAGSAAAIPGLPDCKTAPTPAVPGRGYAGWLAPTPHGAVPTPDPKPGDLYAVYGWSSFGWSTYDTGCTANPTNAAGKISANTAGFLANTLQAWNLAWGAITASLLDAVLRPTWLSALDPLVERAVEVLGPVFQMWAPIAFALTGLLILWMSYRWAMRRVFIAVGGAIVVISATLSVMTWPVAAGRLLDSGIGSAAGIAAQTTTAGSSQTDPAINAIGAYYSSIYYTQWLNGQLGCTPETCAVAEKYGLGLFDATHYTIREAATIKAGGDAADRITEAKAEKFTDLAGKVHDEDQAAYDMLKGEDGTQRMAAAALTTVGGTATMPFLIAACLLLIFAFLASRVVVMAIPLIGAIGIFPKTRGVFTGALGMAGWAALNGIAFFVGAMVDLLAVGALLDPSTPLSGPVRLILCALLQVALWAVLKPHRKIFRHVTSPAVRGLKFAATAAATGGAAGFVAGYVADGEGKADPAPEPERGSQRAEMWVDTPPPPAVPFQPARAETAALPVAPSPDHPTWTRDEIIPEGTHAAPVSEDGAYEIYRPSEDPTMTATADA